MGVKDDKPVIETKSYKTGGDNVIQFPGTSRESVIENEEYALKQSQKLLRYHHEQIKKTMAILAEHQLRCAKTEDDYDDMLKAFADRVGVENVSITHMNYGSHVKPVIKNGKMELVID